MKQVLRVDTGSISSIEDTPQGGIRVDGFITRTGVFRYVEDGKEVFEYRPPEEVFHEDSLASLLDAPVTDFHPPELVTARNYKKYASGHVQAGSVRQDGDKVTGRFVIQDGTAVSAVKAKKRKEISGGYVCQIDPTPGMTPEGERYDRVQRSIRYNHVAVVPKGRAGSEISLRLDSQGNQMLSSDEGADPPKGVVMKIRIDGVDFPVSSEAEVKSAIAAFERYDAQQAEKVKDLTARLDAETGRADASEAKAKELEEKVAGLEDPKRFDEAVASRLALVERARAVLGKDVKLDGLTEREIMVQAVTKSKPEVKLDEKSDDYVRAWFDALGSAVKKSAAEQIHRTDGKDAPTGESPIKEARKRYDEYIRSIGTQPFDKPVA